MRNSVGRAKNEENTEGFIRELRTIGDRNYRADIAGTSCHWERFEVYWWMQQELKRDHQYVLIISCVLWTGMLTAVEL